MMLSLLPHCPAHASAPFRFRWPVLVQGSHAAHSFIGALGGRIRDLARSCSDSSDGVICWPVDPANLRCCSQGRAAPPLNPSPPAGEGCARGHGFFSPEAGEVCPFVVS